MWGRTDHHLITIWPAPSFPSFQECAGGAPPPAMLTHPVEAYVPRSFLEAGEIEPRSINGRWMGSSYGGDGHCQPRAASSLHSSGTLKLTYGWTTLEWGFGSNSCPPRSQGAGAGCSMSAASLTLMRTLYIKTGPRNSLSAPDQVAKVDPFQNCGGRGFFWPPMYIYRIFLRIFFAFSFTFFIIGQ